MKIKNYYSFLSSRLMRLYTVYVIIFTLAAYSLCLIYVHTDNKRTEEKYISQITNNVESYLLNTSHITSGLSANKKIVDFFDSGEYNLTKITEIMGIISSTKVSGMHNSTVVLVNLQKNIAVSSTGTMSAEYAEEICGIDSGALALKAKKQSNANNYMEIICSESNGKDILSDKLVSVSIKHSESGSPMIFLVSSDVKDFFDGMPNESVPHIVNLKVGKDNLDISYYSNKEDNVEFGDTKKHRGYITLTSQALKNMFWGNIDCTVYVSAVSYFMHINNFFVFLLLFVVALAFAGHLYIKKKALQLYRPIKKILSTLPKNSGADDEFEAVSKLFNSLESQKNAMSEIISKNQIQLRDRFLNQLTASTLTREQIKCELVNHNLEEVEFPGAACIICYKNFDELKSILTIDGLAEVRDAIKECFEKYFEKAKFTEITDIDQESFCAIICPQKYEWLENQLRKCVLNIEAVLDINIVVFMGKKADSWYDIPASYAEALGLKNKSRIISEESIVITKKEDRRFESPAYTTEQETELIDYVFQNNKSMVYMCLKNIIDLNFNNAYLHHEYFSHFVTMIYSTVIKILFRINKTEKEVFAPMSVYLELMNSANPESFAHTLTSIFDTLMSNIEAMQKDTITDSSEYILSYVNRHYNEDISLYTLAEYLNMSQSYASRIFKQITGENFKDYLTNVRLAKAIEFMSSDPYVKLNDVAKRVGYTSETFTRAFTKKYNVTPSAYMKKKND